MSEEIDVGSFEIRDVEMTIEGVTPYSPSRALADEDSKQKSESWEDFEARVWRKKAHVAPDKSGNNIMFIPGSAFKLSLDEGVQNINERIPGKGNQTYTGVIKMGIAPLGDLDLGINIDDVSCVPVYCHANGKRGPGPRVMRWFPIVYKWGGNIRMRIFNDSLTAEKFEEFFSKAGLIAGVGRGRPSTGCPMGNGRYKVREFHWT